MEKKKKKTKTDNNNNKKFSCKDRCHKTGTGFNNSLVLRNKKQEKKYSKFLNKKIREGEQAIREMQAIQGKDGGKDLFVNQNRFDSVGGFVDLTAWLAEPENFSESGRPKYLDPRAIPVMPFNPWEQMPRDMNPSLVCYGKRRTGKSTFLDWLFSIIYSAFDQCFVFTETKTNGFWNKRVPDQAVYPKWLPNAALQIIDLQKKAHVDPDRAWREDRYTTSTAIILDDVIASNVLRHDGESGPFGKLYVEGRHYGKGDREEGKGGFMIVTNTQHATALHPKVRDNVDFAVILKQDKRGNQERIAEEYMSRLNKATAMNLMDLYTSVVGPRAEELDNDDAPRRVLVINLQPTRSWNNRFYWVIPGEPEDNYKIGSKEFWEQFSKKP